ncbi:NAD kinase [Wigglesworthia glossinidia endosymbiont of Glossina morsitans morsitans (Yale colony)]|uniref:NAD kinase n=1 Tax=Wigglesworthia glossinidia endosymbiont of Glossina morsitans morsitans (Yale colony) TaxID=1142511 RepID=H6Q5S1_WIGGL|nr:NAD(+)/NADH kinase [Wigglesworthia glossinidia]AFA40976.1 NAD kinase [Wigglesworthia glossinidia endosymbiont of Glossina morsitans morsitans (Yale colony)]
MNHVFKIIGIMGYQYCLQKLSIYNILYNWLKRIGYTVILELNIAKILHLKNILTGNIVKIGKISDLVIIVGGDGSILKAAKILSVYSAKIIGINMGSLGFLTDLDPHSALKELQNILNGNFYIENRFLLDIHLFKNNFYTKKKMAINEIVIHSQKIAKIIEFEVYIDRNFAFFQKSDGLIISTPTGSTAYSLSAGGPILIPTLNVIMLIPMFSHELSSRTLIISNKSIIEIKFPRNMMNVIVSCDGKTSFKMSKNAKIFIQKSKFFLKLLHSNNYKYFHVLNKKLGWSTKYFK